MSAIIRKIKYGLCFSGGRLTVRIYFVDCGGSNGHKPNVRAYITLTPKGKVPGETDSRYQAKAATHRAAANILARNFGGAAKIW